MVEKLAYPLMRRWIYGGAEPYITPDEHKIDERELAFVLALLEVPEVEFFGLADGRLFPSHMRSLARLDKRIMRLAGPAAARLGGRVVFSGTRKA